jgi:hypothetical protein
MQKRRLYPSRRQEKYLRIYLRWFVPIRKYKREPRKGRKIMRSTQIIFSFPGKLPVRALTSATSGKRMIKSINTNVIIIPPPRKNRKVIIPVLMSDINL